MARDPYKVWPPLELPAGPPPPPRPRHTPPPSASILAAAPARAARATHYNVGHMLLAGDLGGTKTLLGLFRQTGTARPELVVSHEYATLEFPSATDILAAFLKTADVAADALDAACFGVPGP